MVSTKVFDERRKQFFDQEQKNLAMVKQVKIERGVEIPRPFRPGAPEGWKSILFRRMKPGDSVFLPGLTSTAQVDCAASRIFGARNYAARTLDGGVRVWRKK